MIYMILHESTLYTEKILNRLHKVIVIKHFLNNRTSTSIFENRFKLRNSLFAEFSYYQNTRYYVTQKQC